MLSIIQTERYNSEKTTKNIWEKAKKNITCTLTQTFKKTKKTTNQINLNDDKKTLPYFGSMRSDMRMYERP